MKQSFAYLSICTSLLSCLFIFGCASTKNKQSEETTQPITTNTVMELKVTPDIVSNIHTNETTNIVTKIETPKGATDASKKNILKDNPVPYISPIKETPKAWDIIYSTKQKFVKIDNASIALYEKTQTNIIGKVYPNFIDKCTTIDVILDTHTTPIATNRPFRVFIDPGHGGNDPGAIIKKERTFEKTLALDIALRLQKHLTNAGFVTTLSRTDNKTTLSLDERCIMANQWNADMFISIHINSSTSAIPNGYETYVLANVGKLSTSMDATQMTSDDWSFVNERYIGNKNDKRNLLLGFAIHRKMINNINIADRGLRRARFYVLREVSMPAVLVECGYLSSPIDSKHIKTAAYRENCARGIYQGICDYAYGRMLPGLKAVDIPSPNNNAINVNHATSEEESSLSTNSYNTKKEEIINTNPEPVWTPNYSEDDSSLNPEIAAARAKALADAGITLTTKEPSKSPTKKK